MSPLECTHHTATYLKSLLADGLTMGQFKVQKLTNAEIGCFDINFGSVDVQIG
jgi:hypothetical protein